MSSVTSYEISDPLPMKIQACPECAGYFGITVAFDEMRREDGESFYCPAGHKQSYSKEELERGEQQKFSTEDYANNAVLKSQVEYLSRKLKELTSKSVKSGRHLPQIRKKGV